MRFRSFIQRRIVWVIAGGVLLAALTAAFAPARAWMGQCTGPSDPNCDNVFTNNSPLPGNFTGTNNRDAMINNSTVGDQIQGLDSDDYILNNGNVTTIIDAGAGDDIIVNNGTVNDEIQGGAGNDVIINRNNVWGDINGGANDDQITHTGYATNIIGGDGSDTVTIGDGGFVDNTINGGNGSDTLIFDLSTVWSSDYWAARQALQSANPAGGSLQWEGNTYVWTLFEFLINRIRLIQGPLPDLVIITDDGNGDEVPLGTTLLPPPRCSFLINAHGPKWVKLDDCYIEHGAPLYLLCLDSEGNWTDAYIRNTSLTENGDTLFFEVYQHGFCAAFGADEEGFDDGGE